MNPHPAITSAAALIADPARAAMLITTPKICGQIFGDNRRVRAVSGVGR
jgi:hypothetical protein